MNPEYPIYIPSKGRWESLLTVKTLEKMGVPYKIVVEPQEYEQYASAANKDNILVLPFSNLGQGSIPARNWIWGHSIKAGAARHWVIDDNIRWFRRLNRNKRIRVSDGTIFRAAEDFVDRYENVKMAGFNYTFFAEERGVKKPFYLNTRVYSCILLSNDIPHRWRGRYNEDTDLSIRILKSGYCTVLFNAFLCDKAETMSMKGGNTDELYRQGKKYDGRFEMMMSLIRQHPDIVRINRRFGRWQHLVDYRPFRRNRLVKRGGLKIPSGINNYGMALANI